MLTRRIRLPRIAATLALSLGNLLHISAQGLADALDTTNLVWATGGNSVWFPQTTNTHDGVDATCHGNVASNETSWLETTIMGPATVRFWTSSVWESWPSAYVGFSINGSSGVGGPGPPRPSLPGMTWYESILDLGVGTNVLRWTAFNPYGATNSSFRALDQIVVSPPRPLEIVYQPQGLEVYSGESPSMSVAAIGTPPLHYQWQREGADINGATNSWFYIESASTNDAGAYSVIVSNSQGLVVSSNALLTVLPPTAPAFHNEPDNVSAYAGDTAYLLAGVVGSPPFDFQWRKDGTNLPGTLSIGYHGNWNYLTITNLSSASTGEYSLAVTNAQGYAISSNATLTVLQPVAPTIIHQPRSLEVAAGANTWLTLVATGAPSPSLTWTKVGAPPFPPPAWLPPIAQPGGIALPPQSLSLTNVTTNTAGIYFVTASNLAGVVTSVETLVSVLPPITNMGSWWQGAEAVFVTNGLAFLAQGASGLGILDVSNPAMPFMLGGYNTPGFAGAVCAAGGWAYVADGSAGLQILSITNPFNPTLVGNYNTPNFAAAAIVRSNLVYVADENALLIINVADKAAPSLIGSFTTNLYLGRIALAGNLAFLTGSGGMLIVDVSNPAQPFEVARLSGVTGAIDIREQLAFASGDDDLLVINVSNPAQPVVVGSLSGVYCSDLRVVHDLVYLVSGFNSYRLYVVDVRNPVLPIPVGQCFLVEYSDWLFVEGNRVFLCGDNTIKILQTPFNHPPITQPTLSMSAQPVLNLTLHGRRGLHYDLEFADSLVSPQWQQLQTLLLTDDTVILPAPVAPGTRFFRLKQLD